MRRAPSPTGSIESTVSFNSPLASQNVRRPRTRTVSPFSGLNRIFQLVPFQHTHLSCESPSLRLKYQCPEDARRKSTTSPSTQTDANWRSTASRTCAFNSETVHGRRSSSSNNAANKGNSSIRKKLYHAIPKLPAYECGVTRKRRVRSLSSLSLLLST